MNERFFQLPAEKQARILNAGYKVFSENRYAKAPMSEIASEGCISKSLLFHYFHNKKELYLYLLSNAIKLTDEIKREYMVYETDDVFEMLIRGLSAKVSLMRKYPYIMKFSIMSYYEQDVSVSYEIRKMVDSQMDISSDNIRSIISDEYIRDDVSFEDMLRQIIYSSIGMLDSWYHKGDLNIDEFESEYRKLISHFRLIYGRNSI